MMLFYVGASVLALLAVIFVVWPILMSRRSGSSNAGDANFESSLNDERELTNVVLYKDHLDDLEKSLSSGAITQAQYDELKLELERNLLEDSQPNKAVEQATSQATESSVRSRWVLWGIMLLVPVFAVWLYTQLGSYHSWQIKSLIAERSQLQRDFLSSASSAQASGHSSPGNSENNAAIQAQITQKDRELLTSLKQYIVKKPDDLQMRALLARTHMGFAEYPPAIKQFQAILSREPDASQIMAELAQAIFLQAGNRVVPGVQILVDKTLALDAENTVALGLSGIAAFQNKQYQQAISVWQKAVSLQGPNSANGRALQNGIRSAQALLAAQAPAALTTEQSATESTASNSDAAEPVIRVAVSLAEQVNYSPTDTVFIYARAWQGAKIPLAIARIQASQLPITIDLTNAMSMAPSMNLSTAKQFELVARLSKSGDPIAKPGDWQAALGPVEIDPDQQKPHSLIISQTISP